MQNDQILKFDLSNKSPQEIAQFLSILLAAKRQLFHQHALNMRLLPKVRKVHLNNSSDEN